MSYLVETYGAGSDSAGRTTRHEEVINAAVAEVQATGSAVEFVASMSIPGDETTFYLFEAQSAEVVAEVMRRAGMVAERVVEAVASELMSRWPAVAGGSAGGP
jgi:hypothetical protein